MAVAALVCLQSGSAQAFKGGGFDGTVNVEPTSQVSFDLVKKRKLIGPHRWRRTSKIRNVEFAQALAGCEAGLIAPIDAVIPGSAKLKKKGRFVLKASRPGASLFVSGRFAKRFKAAYGRFQLSMPFVVDGVTRSCDTGPRGWTAERTSTSHSAGVSRR